MVCDDDVDVTNLDHMLWAMVTRTDPWSRSSSSAAPGIPTPIPRFRRNARKAGNITHSVALINACKPYHWKDEFPPSNTPSPEVTRKAKEKFGWLLNGKDRP